MANKFQAPARERREKEGKGRGQGGGTGERVDRVGDEDKGRGVQRVG